MGRIVERALGLSAAPLSAADFETLGVELKTLPVSGSSRPRESTFVCYVALSSLVETPWEASRVACKLARVLFVPIESEPHLRLAERRVGSARVLLVAIATRERTLAGRLRRASPQVRAASGQLETLDARVGRVLQLRPTAAHGAVRVRASDGEGVPCMAQPRAFYLRAGFTGEVYARCTARRPRLGTRVCHRLGVGFRPGPGPCQRRCG